MATHLGGQLLAIQQGGVKWVHQDPVVKSQRLTDYNQNVVAGVELDPWGGETSRSWQQGQQRQRFTSYLRDGNESDEAMMRRYNRWWSRFDQPDPYDGSYNLSDPQSLNRYSYVQNDPVNFTDPTGLDDDVIVINIQDDVIVVNTWARRWNPYEGLFSLMRGRAELDRALVMPVGTEGGIGGGLTGSGQIRWDAVRDCSGAKTTADKSRASGLTSRRTRFF